MYHSWHEMTAGENVPKEIKLCGRGSNRLHIEWELGRG